MAKLAKQKPVPKSKQQKTWNGDSKVNILKHWSQHFKNAFSRPEKVKFVLQHKNDVFVEGILDSREPAILAAPGGHKVQDDGADDVARKDAEDWHEDGGEVLLEALKDGGDVKPNGGLTGLVPRVRGGARRGDFWAQLEKENAVNRRVTAKKSSRELEVEIAFDASQKNSKRASCPAGSRSSPQDSIGSNITFVQPVYQELEHPSPTRAIPTRVNVQTQSTAHWEALVASSKVENEEADAAEWQALIQYNQLRHQLEFAFQRDQEEKRVQGLQDEQEKVLDGIKERLVEERTRSFTAEGTVSALEVDLANQKDDYEAEIEDLKDERDAALAALKEREEELKYQTSVKEEYLEAAAKATRERELLEDALEVKQQVVQSVSLASQSLQARCDRLEAQNVALLEEQAQGSTDQHIQDQAIITHFEKENAELRRTQDATEAENRELGQNLHQAIIDVGFTHAQNMGYRAAMEDENPARTAHLDGLLKVKDDAYHELEERVSMLSNAVAEERTFKAIRNEEAAGEIEGLQGELEWREAALQAVTQSRDLLQERTDSILQLLKSKIHHDDAVKAICSSHDAINTDNEMLISTLQHRDRIVSTATKETSALRTKIFDLETAAAKSHDQLQRQQSEISALEINDTRLQWITDTQPETFAHEKAALEARLQEQTLQIRNLLASGLSAGVIAFMDSKDAQIAQLQGQLQEWVSGYHQLQARLREGQSEYCPLFDNAPVWEEEKLRHRLRVAEMLLGGPLGEVVRGYEGWGPREAWFGLGRGGVGE